MSEQETVRVNFGNPAPVFPLAGVVLLPHAVIPLHIFEERYRQMVSDALDGSGQIAMALFEGEDWRTDYAGNPAIRPAVCLGQIVQHEALPGGRFNILLRGICRAKIVEEFPPDDDYPYRRARLEPLETPSENDNVEDDLVRVRGRLKELLAEPPLTRLSAAESLESHLERNDLPTSAILELLGMTVVSDNEMKYRLLETRKPVDRAAIIEHELESLRSLLKRADPQYDPEAPKGVTWN
jgi:Lon protease-like protein